MTNVTQISLESLLLRATNPINTSLETAAVEAFFVLVSKERDGPAVGVKVIASRLPVGSEKEVLSTLNVLDMCMSKCGSAFQSEVGKFRFLNEMIKLVSPKYLGAKTPLSVKQRVLQLLYLWTLDYPKEVKIKEAFEMLRKQGVIREIPNPNIPPEALGHESRKRVTNSIFQDEEKSNILRKLLQSKDPEDIQAANWLIKSMVKEDEKMADLKSKAITELESVQNNLRLLNEMMGSYKKGVTTRSELDLMRELYDNVVRLTPSLTTIACENEHCPVDLIESVLKTMDDLTESCTKYKLEILEEKPDTPPGNWESLLVLNEQAAEEQAQVSQSLIEMDHQMETENNVEDYSCSNQNGNRTSHVGSTNAGSSMNVLCDVFSGLVDVPTSTEILQPVAASSSNIERISAERDTEKSSKLKALEDLDVLGEHLLKENLPSSSYRNQDKIPMNLLTKINEIKRSQQLNNNTTQTSNESLKLDLNYLLENPVKESSLSQSKYKSDENLSQVDSTDDCLVDITEDSDRLSEKAMECGVGDRRNSRERNGDLASEIIQKLSEEQAGQSSKINEKGNGKVTVNVSSSASTTNLKDIVVKLEDIKPSCKKSIVALDEKNGLTVLLHLAKDRPRSGVSVYVVTTISRNEMPLSNYYFQAVVPKDCKLKLQPPSSTDLPAFNPFLPPAAITQIMLIAHPEESHINLKYVISYLMDDDTVTEMGEVETLPLGE